MSDFQKRHTMSSFFQNAAFIGALLEQKHRTHFSSTNTTKLRMTDPLSGTSKSGSAIHWTKIDAPSLYSQPIAIGISL
jgi:hypothetical protein